MVALFWPNLFVTPPCVPLPGKKISIMKNGRNEFQSYKKQTRVINGGSGVILGQNRFRAL